MNRLQPFGRHLLTAALLAALTAGAVASTSAAPAAARCDVRSWVVGPADSLTSIALAVYGNGDLWEVIYAANRGLIGGDPNVIVDGTRLTIPPDPVACKRPPTATPKPQAKPTARPAKPQPQAPAGPRPGASYVVRAGDSLASIARAAYGNEAQWERIYDANRGVIGSVPLVKVGMRLAIPGGGGGGGGGGGTVGTFEYTVRAGDSLASLARQYLGNEAQWEKIYDLNRAVIGPTPILRVGLRLRVPGNAPAAKPAAKPGARPAPQPTKRPAARPQPTAAPARPQPTAVPAVPTYVVKEGDTLASIAIKFYGDPMRLVDIYEANKSVIGPDPEGIRPGMVLVIPRINR